jgi:hypothetical protein
MLPSDRGRSRWSDQPEFVVVTHWDSVAALEEFAGPRWPEAVIEPDEEQLLAEVFCDHYETVARLIASFHISDRDASGSSARWQGSWPHLARTGGRWPGRALVSPLRPRVRVPARALWLFPCRRCHPSRASSSRLRSLAVGQGNEEH